MSLEIRIYSWNHHHNLCHKHPSFKSFLPSFFVITPKYKIYPLSKLLKVNHPLIYDFPMVPYAIFLLETNLLKIFPDDQNRNNY